jgi:hypothetical protein
MHDVDYVMPRATGWVHVHAHQCPTHVVPASNRDTGNIGPCDGVFHHQRRDDAAPRRPEKDLAPYRSALV